MVLLHIVLAVCDIGSASFKYDMRRLSEILALPKAWYRRSLARRMFLGEETAMGYSDSGQNQHIAFFNYIILKFLSLNYYVDNAKAICLDIYNLHDCFFILAASSAS